jgi:hypothetical protein
LAWGTVTAVVTLAKWLALLGFVGAGAMWLVKDSESEAARTTLRRGWRALVHQRLSLLVLAPLAGLALVPRGDISDQVPDVQRAWADSLTGLGEAVLAGVVLLAVSLGLFVLGRLRSDHVYRLVASSAAHPHQPGAVPPPLGRVLSWVQADPRRRLSRLRRERSSGCRVRSRGRARRCGCGSSGPESSSCWAPGWRSPDTVP